MPRLLSARSEGWGEGGGTKEEKNDEVRGSEEKAITFLFLWPSATLGGSRREYRRDHITLSTTADTLTG